MFVGIGLKELVQSMIFVKSGLHQKKLRRSKLLKSTHFEAVADANHYCHFNGIIVVCIENAVS